MSKSVSPKKERMYTSKDGRRKVLPILTCVQLPFSSQLGQTEASETE